MITVLTCFDFARIQSADIRFVFRHDLHCTVTRGSRAIRYMHKWLGLNYRIFAPTDC